MSPTLALGYDSWIGNSDFGDHIQMQDRQDAYLWLRSPLQYIVSDRIQFSVGGEGRFGRVDHSWNGRRSTFAIGQRGSVVGLWETC